MSCSRKAKLYQAKSSLKDRNCKKTNRCYLNKKLPNVNRNIYRRNNTRKQNFLLIINANGE